MDSDAHMNDIMGKNSVFYNKHSILVSQNNESYTYLPFQNIFNDLENDTELSTILHIINAN